MDNSYQYETEIDLKELLYSIFRKWRIIVVCGILCAAAFGAYKYMDARSASAMEAFEDQVKAYEQSLVSYNNTMEDYDRAVEEFETADTELEYQSERLEYFEGLLEDELRRIEDSTLSSEDVANSYMRIEILKEFINECESEVDKLETMKAPAEPTAKEPEYPTPNTSPVKYIALGLVLGVFGAAFVVCVVDLMSDKIKDIKDITRRYGLRTLGEFRNDGKKVGRVFGFIDRLIIKIFGHESLISEDEAYALAAANFDNFELETPVKSVLITGFADDKKLEALASNMKSRTKGDVEFIYGKSPVISTETTKSLPEVDAVVLAEERNRSTNAGVEREIAVIKDMGKDIFGVILV